MLVGVGIGVTIPLLAFRRFTPNATFPIAYRRGRTAHLDVGGSGAGDPPGLHDQLGLPVEDVHPSGRAGSAGSTPLRITVTGDPPTQLVGKLHANATLRADRWDHLGRLEDQNPCNTVHRLVQQDDHARQQRSLAGRPTPPRRRRGERPPPAREYLLVSEFSRTRSSSARPRSPTGCSTTALGAPPAVARRAGAPRRQARQPAGRGWSAAADRRGVVEVRPSPWRRAVDLANLLVWLGLRSGAEGGCRRALRRFSVAEISEGFAAARGLALPSQLPRMLHQQGRDLHADFLGLLPARPRPIRIQRWSGRRFGLLLSVVPLVAAR